MISQEASPKLSIFCISHSASLGGAERSLADLVGGLQERGVACTVLLPNPGPLKTLLERYQINVLVSSFPYSWWASVSWENHSDMEGMASYAQCISETSALIASLKPDFILSQTIVIPWGALCAGILGIPHILSVREYGERDHNLNFRFGFRPSIDALYHDSQLVFSITHDVANELFPGDPLNKIEVIYGSVEIPLEYRNMRHPAFLHSPLEAGTIRVLLLGNISQGKHQKDAVHAIHLLRKAGQDFALRIVGPTNDPKYQEEVVALVKEYGLTEWIQVVPDITDPYEELSTADIVISCSPCEAMGRTLIEAAQLGRPIVFPDSCGPKEIFLHGDHGLAFAVGDHEDLARQLSIAVSSREKTLERAEKSRAHVRKKFTQDNYAGVVLSAMVRHLKGPVLPSQQRVRKLLQATSFEGLAVETLGFRQRYQDLVALLTEKNTEIERLSAWGRELEKDLAQTRAQVATRGQEIEGLSSWGRLLETELNQTRNLLGTKEEEISRLSAWGRELENDLAQTRAQVATRGQEIEGLSSWGRLLETELNQTRSLLGTKEEEIDRLSAWGRELNSELLQARRTLDSRGEDIERLSHWGRGLDSELAQTRSIVESRGEEIERLSDWGRALEVELLETRNLSTNRGLEIESFQRSVFGKLYNFMSRKKQAKSRIEIL